MNAVLTFLVSKNDGADTTWSFIRYEPFDQKSQRLTSIPVEMEVSSFIASIVARRTINLYERFCLRALLDLVRVLLDLEQSDRFSNRLSMERIAQKSSVKDVFYDQVFMMAHCAVFSGVLQGSVQFPAGQQFHEFVRDLARLHSVAATVQKMIRWQPPKWARKPA